MNTTLSSRPAGTSRSNIDTGLAQAQQEHNALQTSINYSNESERLVCAAMLDPAPDEPKRALQSRLAALLAHGDFHLDEHQSIWALATALQGAGKTSDPVSVSDAAQRQDVWVGGPAYIASLIDDPLSRSASDEAIAGAAQRIKQLAMLRQLQRCLQDALEKASKGADFDSVASFVEDDLINLRRSSESSRTGPQPLSVYVDRVLAKMQDRMDRPDSTAGASTGLADLDKITGGLPDESLIILAARPSMGKTGLSRGIESHIAQFEGRPTLYFSLETPGEALARRDLAHHAQVDITRIRDANLSDDQWGRVSDAAERMLRVDSHIDDSPSLTLSEIRARARAFVREHPNAVIMVDYLQLVEQETGTGAGKKFSSNDSAHTGAVSRGLKNLARELRCPVVALAQLNRSVEQRTNKRPMMSDLRESGQIEQDADFILFIYRDEYYNPESQDVGIAEIIVAKNKDGPTGTARVGFQAATVTFHDLNGVGH